MFFNAPPTVEASLFGTIPASWLPNEPNPEWRAGQPASTPARSLIEGPSFDRQGQLYCVDLPNGRIMRVSPQGVFSIVAEYDGWPNGLKIHRDGRIFVADFKRGIVTVDPETGVVTPVLERAQLEHFKGVNDLFFAANGDLYFTDQGMTGHHDPSGRLFRLTPAGKVTCLLDNIPSPNGLVMDLEENAILLAVTRANAVWRVPMNSAGDVTRVGTFIQLSGGNGPDGLAMNAEGGLAIAHIGLGSIWLFDRYGEPTTRIKVGAHRHTTNVAYGGPDGRTLFITESGSGAIYSARVSVPGKPMFSHL